MTLFDVVVTIALTLMGLAGGTFWSFSTGVMPGLRRTDDATFVTAMREINRAVLNPLFLGPIFLAPVLLGWAAFLDPGESRRTLLFVAALVYLFGTVGVTILGNVPLNKQLDESRATPTATRTAFERPWNQLNALRAIASLAAVALSIAALAQP